MDQSSGPGLMELLILLIVLIFTVLLVAGQWKVFAKAGKPGWTALIPIYNWVVWMEIVGRPLWWVILLFVPIVGLVVYIIISLDLSKSFGHGTLFGFVLAFFPAIALAILGFGDAKYVGRAALTPGT